LYAADCQTLVASLVFPASRQSDQDYNTTNPKMGRPIHSYYLRWSVSPRILSLPRSSTYPQTTEELTERPCRPSPSSPSPFPVVYCTNLVSLSFDLIPAYVHRRWRPKPFEIFGTELLSYQADVQERVPGCGHTCC